MTEKINRREFLKRAGIAAGSVAAGAVTEAAAKPVQQFKEAVTAKDRKDDLAFRTLLAHEGYFRALRENAEYLPSARETAAQLNLLLAIIQPFPESFSSEGSPLERAKRSLLQKMAFEEKYEDGSFLLRPDLLIGKRESIKKIQKGVMDAGKGVISRVEATRYQIEVNNAYRFLDELRQTVLPSSGL